MQPSRCLLRISALGTRGKGDPACNRLIFRIPPCLAQAIRKIIRREAGAPVPAAALIQAAVPRPWEKRRGRCLNGNVLVFVTVYQGLLESQLTVRRLAAALSVLAGAVRLQFECGGGADLIYVTARQARAVCTVPIFFEEHRALTARATARRSCLHLPHLPVDKKKGRSPETLAWPLQYASEVS